MNLKDTASSLFSRERPPTELECYLELVNAYKKGYEDGAKNDWWKSREKTKEIAESLIKEYRDENNLDE